MPPKRKPRLAKNPKPHKPAPRAKRMKNLLDRMKKFRDEPTGPAYKSIPGTPKPRKGSKLYRDMQRKKRAEPSRKYASARKKGKSKNA